MNRTIQDNLAPVCVFCYKRLDSLKLCLDKLQLCRYSNETNLFIFSDGPKNSKDEAAVLSVRSYLKELKGFKTIELTFSPDNKGLANSIISGVSGVVKKYGKVIVLEDDLIVSSNFLEFMNQNLVFYEDNLHVFSISGFSLPLKMPKNFKYDVYFLPRASSWGWATWKNRWEKVDWSVSDYRVFIEDKQAIRQFNKGGSDMFSMLKKQMQGKIDSWAIRWCYHQFRVNSNTVYPVTSKVDNIGFNAEATNTHVYNRHQTILDSAGKSNFNLPQKTDPDKEYLMQFQHFYSIQSRLFGKVKTILKMK